MSRARASARTRTPRCASWISRHASWARRPAASPSSRPSSSAAAPRRCCPPTTSSASSRRRASCSVSPRGARSRRRPTPIRSTRPTCAPSPTVVSRASASACSRPSRTCSRRSSARTTRPTSNAPCAPRRTSGCRSASISSTARRVRVSTTGAPRSTRRSRWSPTTSAPTPSSSRRARRWGRRCVAASCPCPMTTTRPTSTSSPTPCSRMPGTTGTRCRTGRARRRRSAATTSRTGATSRGGVSAPARTATSAACAGGTSSIRAPTPNASTRGSRRRWHANCSTSASAMRNASYSRCASPRDFLSTFSTRTGDAPSPASSPRG